MIGETFFSELTLNDKRGQVTVTAKEFGEYIGYSSEQLQIRLDKDRSFAYCTSKAEVYDVVDESCDSDVSRDADCRLCNNEGCSALRSIQTRLWLSVSEGVRTSTHNLCVRTDMSLCRRKPTVWVSRPDLTQTGLYKHRRCLEAGYFGFRK